MTNHLSQYLYMDVHVEDMHIVWFSMWNGFFSPWVFESRPIRVATRVGYADECWEIHLAWKTIQNAFSHILYTLGHFNQAEYNVQSCISWKPCEMDLSHNCSLHGGRSEVCENDFSWCSAMPHSSQWYNHPCLTIFMVFLIELNGIYCFQKKRIQVLYIKTQAWYIKWHKYKYILFNKIILSTALS